MSKRLYKYTEITDLKDMLKKYGKEYGEKTAYKIRIDNGKYKEITHKEVRKMIESLGTALINMGLKNKRIAVIGENRYEWEIAYLSIVCGTGIVVPLDKSLPENELKELIKRSGVEAIFYSAKYEQTLKNIKLQGIGKLKHLISMDLKEHKDGIYSQSELIEVGRDLIDNGNTEFTNAKINNEEMNIMLFTSGTTSKSKVVALSHKNICSNLMDIASILDVNSNDVFLSFLPLHHVFECTVGFLFSLYKGAQTVFCDGIRHIPENMKEYKVSVMASVPAIYERLFKIIRKQIEKKGNLEEILQKEEEYKNASMETKKEVFKEIHEMLGGNVKLLISGAASLDATIEQRFRNLGLNLVQVYGLTETSPEKIKAENGKIDGIVHAIAHANTEDLHNDFIYTSKEGFAHACDVSSYSFVLVARMAKELDMLNENASLITLTYHGSTKVLEGYNVMGVAKAALEASVRYLAENLGKEGIRVNAVSAGPIKTLSAKGIKDFNSILTVIEEKAPLHKNVTTVQVGNVATFLLSQMSDSITGQVIYADNGYNIMGI